MVSSIIKCTNLCSDKLVCGLPAAVNYYGGPEGHFRFYFHKHCPVLFFFFFFCFVFWLLLFFVPWCLLLMHAFVSIIIIIIIIIIKIDAASDLQGHRKL